MSTTNKDPYLEAEKLGLEICHTNTLPTGIDGLYTGDRLLVRPHLPNRFEISTLWHELGHHHYGLTHVPSHLSSRLEYKCDCYAAEHLINQRDLEILARIYPDDSERIAYELGVTQRILKAYLSAHPYRQAVALPA
ncbi:ImmA/IrrE family metallo-endopeptidase [Rothia sp. P5764]|uniref:ImmA/IrrE family metallo-endopeptidase n=1 Tax=Rothia sp. P5764 TaxID=3402654 RepID=UPI003ACE46D1